MSTQRYWPETVTPVLVSVPRCRQNRRGRIPNRFNVRRNRTGERSIAGDVDPIRSCGADVDNVGATGDLCKIAVDCHGGNSAENASRRNRAKIGSSPAHQIDFGVRSQNATGFILETIEVCSGERDIANHGAKIVDAIDNQS